MKDSISRWSLHYEGWAAEHNISCLPRGNRSRGKGLSLLSPCRGGAPPFSPALPSYSVSLLFLLFAPAVTKPHSGRFSSAFRPFCSANPAAGSRNMHSWMNLVASSGRRKYLFTNPSRGLCCFSRWELRWLYFCMQEWRSCFCWKDIGTGAHGVCIFT